MSGACPLMVARTTTTRSPSTSPSAAPSSSLWESDENICPSISSCSAVEPMPWRLIEQSIGTFEIHIAWHHYHWYPHPPLFPHSCPAKRRQPETTKPTSRADYLTSSQIWVSVRVCLSVCVRIELSGGSWQRVTDLNNFAKRLPRPLPTSPSHVFVVCAVRQHVKTLNANRRMRSRTWLQIPGNGYGFSRAARWDQQPSRECLRGGGRGSRVPTPTISLSKVLCVPRCLVPFFAFLISSFSRPVWGF